mmetsp:Transcript_12266/g.34019  ORF Transcript_12266/g.34019 Transcript_12266/m.34019 type:complete len:236 (-) Transcript_12266:121-828(-)
MQSSSLLLASLTIFGLCLHPLSAWVLRPQSSSASRLFLRNQHHVDEHLSTTTISRRSFGAQVLSIGAVTTTLLTTQQQPALAAAESLDQEKAKIIKGYQRLGYLLDNWDKETTFCGTQIDPFSGKQVCEKTPLVVQDYMGYKSINDPLFKADKTLKRLEPLVPVSRSGEYLDAIEQWATTADEASGMAYTSSWAGPQNPNGGDDSIAYFLDRSKQQVVTARSVLATVMDILELKE